MRCRSQSKLLQFGDISPSSVRDVELFIFRSSYSRGSTGGAFSSPIRPSAFPEVLPHTENSLCKLNAMKRVLCIACLLASGCRELLCFYPSFVSLFAMLGIAVLQRFVCGTSTDTIMNLLP